MSAKDYQFWNDALAGKNPVATVDQPECGFYRLKRNGRWVPVAVWPKHHGLGFKIGTENVGENMGVELWSHYCANPITEAVYRAVAERGEKWPDGDPIVEAMIDKVAKITPQQIAARINSGEELNPEESARARNAARAADPSIEFKENVTTALGGVPGYAKIESDEASTRAAGLRNMLLALAGEAEEARKAEKKPHWDAAQAVDAKWQPIIKDAQAGAVTVRKSMEAWEDEKREQARKAAQEQAKRDEQHARDTEWANAGKEPAPAPPMPVKPNTPPPLPQIRPTFGKAASAGSKMVVESVDIDKFLAALRPRPEWPTIEAFFKEVAQKLANRGIILDGVNANEKAQIR